MNNAQKARVPGACELTQGTLVVRFLVAWIGVAAGWIAAQGHGLSLATFFTPWHHDDFGFLAVFRGFNPFVTRPVSTNLALFLGQFGATVYYTGVIAIVTAGLAATALVAEAAFERQTSGLKLFTLAMLGSFAWCSQSASVQGFQYSGLITNAVAYLFGFLAVLVLLTARHAPHRPLSFMTIAAVSLLTLASAFAKEDQILFILVGLGLFFIRSIGRDGFCSAARALALLAAGVVVIFAASLIFSSWVRSPITSGVSGGPYDLSQIPKNVLMNLRYYFGISVANRLLIGGWALAALALLRPSTLRGGGDTLTNGVAFVVLGFFALLGPYLILPRFFDFYAMNWGPLLCFAIAPAVGCAMQSPRWTFAARKFSHFAVSAAALAVCAMIFKLADANRQNRILNWSFEVRDRSLKQLIGLRMAQENGMGTCPLVEVAGVSGQLGPFLYTSPAYLRHQLGSSARWQIIVEPGTILDTWSHARSYPSGWSYVPAGTERPEAPCTLSFDPHTLKATFKK